MILVAGCRLEAMKSAVQDEGSALHTVGVRERGSRREREGPLFISFWLFKTDGSLCAERKCLLTQLAHYWWLPANDNNGIGECEQQCSLLSSDALRTEGWQPADTVARPPEPGGASTGTHRTSRQHPAPPRWVTGRAEAESTETRSSGWILRQFCRLWIRKIPGGLHFSFSLVLLRA